MFLLPVIGRLLRAWGWAAGEAHLPSGALQTVRDPLLPGPGLFHSIHCGFSEGSCYGWVRPALPLPPPPSTGQAGRCL